MNTVKRKFRLTEFKNIQPAIRCSFDATVIEIKAVHIDIGFQRGMAPEKARAIPEEMAPLPDQRTDQGYLDYIVYYSGADVNASLAPAP